VRPSHPPLSKRKYQKAARVVGLGLDLCTIESLGLGAPETLDLVTMLGYVVAKMGYWKNVFGTAKTRNFAQWYAKIHRKSVPYATFQGH